MKPTARRRLGKYVLLGRLGAGGMGKIYLAHAPGPAGIDKLLVVKRLHSHLTGDPVLVNSFLDEARLSMALTHPNIVHTYDVGEIDGRYFMVMEYIDGQNLGVILRAAKRSGQYPPSSLWAGMFLSVLDALHAAHMARDARGRPLHIIHRDVSPQNVIITYDGAPKLVDFGIAKAAMRVSETDAGTLKGKYAYMSPEQVRGDVELDARSDVFAAGIVLWEMLAGRRLYKADTIVKSVERILTEPVPSPLKANPACDAGLAAVAVRALQKDREHRYKSADAMKDALEDALLATGGRARTSETKALMQRLFGDVIDKQRQVLEQTLNQHEEIKDGDDDDDSRRHSSDPDNESESDLHMPALSLGHGDTTTPSSQQRSPLVTDDGPPVLAPPKDDPPRTTKMRPPARASMTPQPLTPSTAPHTKDPNNVLAPPLSPHSGSDGDTLTTAPSSSSKRWVPIAAIALVLLLFVCIVIVSGGSGTNNDTPVDDVVAAAPPAPVPVPVVEPVVKDVEPIEKVEPLELVVDQAETEETGQTTKKQQKRPPVPRPRPEPKPTPPPPAVEETVEASGFLTLDTVPWTTVYLGKKKLGETPLVKVPVPAGTLDLTLVNAEEGVREGYIAKVKAGETFRTRLDLR